MFAECLTLSDMRKRLLKRIVVNLEKGRVPLLWFCMFPEGEKGRRLGILVNL